MRRAFTIAGGRWILERGTGITNTVLLSRDISPTLSTGKKPHAVDNETLAVQMIYRLFLNLCLDAAARLPARYAFCDTKIKTRIEDMVCFHMSTTALGDIKGEDESAIRHHQRMLG